MINVSTEIKNAIENGTRITARVNVILKDGTELELDSSRLMTGGLSIHDGTSGSGSFDIGSAIINECVITVNNTDESYSDYSWEEAVATAFVGVMNTAGAFVWLKKGVFTLSDPTNTAAVITLKGVDNMARFDRAYNHSMSFPRTIGSIVNYCCSRCGVDLATANFRNASYQVGSDPFEGNVTYRQILAWCAQIAGCFARCNRDGRLELKWYDRNAFDSGQDLHTVTKFSQGPVVNTEDVVITGVRVTASDGEDGTEGETALYGEEGYVLGIGDNPAIAFGRAQETADLIGPAVVGMRFRPCTASIVGSPAMEAGDAAILEDYKGRTYNAYITNLSYTVGAYASISCDAVPALRKSADRFSRLAATIALLKKEVAANLDAYGQARENLNSLAANALGFYETEEKQDDGSIIRYMHNQPLLDESDVVYKKTADGFFLSRDGGETYENGFDSYGNAVLNVLAAIGINATWINTGELMVSDAQGHETFYVNCDTGVVRINATSFSLTGSTVQQIAQEAVDNIEIGGRNLLLDTDKTVSGTSTASTNGGTVSTSYFYVSDYGKNFTNSEDTVFTVTAWYEFTGDAIDADTRIYAQFHGTAIANIIGNDGSPSDYMTQTTQSGIYKRTFRLTSVQASPGANKRLRMVFRGAPNGAICTLTVTRLKLEVGNVATDWTPAPEDITNSIDGISIGGRNLLLDSEKEVVSPAYESATVYTPYYYVSDYGKPYASEVGRIFTLSAEFEVVGDDGDGECGFYGQCNNQAIANVSNYGTNCNEYVTSNPYTGLYRRTFALTSTQATNADKRIRFAMFKATAGATIKVRRVKLELGNRATDWTLAPEDVETTISDSINVGGRNLILDGNFANDFAKWELQSQSGSILPEITTEDGIKCCHYQGVVGKYAQRRQNIFSRIANDEVGQRYTLSFDMKLVNYTPGTTNPYVKVYFSGKYDNNGTAKFLGATFGKEDSDLASYNNQGWVHVVVSNIYFAHKPINEMWFMIYSRDWSGDLYFTNLKLERGNKATDFTLAPEDVQADIDTATATANAANATAQQANATAQQALDIASSAGGLVAYLDNDYQSVPTDADGNYVTFPECSSKITVFYNSNDVSAQCTYATAVTTGLTGTWDNATRTYSVTGLSTDSGTVTITASYNNTSLSKKFTVIKVRQGISGTNGADGQDGTDGQNGRGVSLMEEYYAISTSNSTAPDSWSTSVVVPTEEYPYLWNYNRVVYTDNTWEDTLPRVIGNFAKDGEDGEDGQNGRGIVSITEYYGLSNSTTTEPTSWSNTIQVPTSSAKYLWNYETITYTDNTTTDTIKRIIGNYASNGAGAYNYELILSDAAIVRDGEGNITPQTITMTAKRNQGTGSPGNYAGRFKVEVTTNGTSYTTAYTSSANEATHTYTPTGNEKNIRVSLYLAGGTTTLLDSQNIPIVSDGIDGVSPTISSSKTDGVTTVTITDASGTRTLTINDGVAGASVATIENRYLASENATGITTTTGGWVQDPSNINARISAAKPYLWNYETIKDDSGRTIATTSPAVIGHFGINGTNGTNGTDGVDGKGIKSIAEYYAINNSTTAPADSNFNQTVKTPTASSRYLWNYEVITYTDNTTTTTAKHVIGVYGDPGTNGQDGADAYTVILSNESHTFAGTGGHAIASSVDCNIIAYKGATRVPATIGTITGTITNKLSVTKTDSGLTTAKITVSATNTLDTQSGVLTIPITVDGKSFTKTFSWSVAYNGSDGVTARSYILDVSPKSVKIGENLAYTPNSITANSYYRDGDSATLTAFSGYMFVEVCNENNAWSAITNCYVSSASTFTFTLTYTTNSTASYNRSTGVLSLPATMSALRIKLKPTSNSSVILDQQDIILLVDISSLTQATIFNKLTDDGQGGHLEGIFMEGGKLYINSSYVRSGTLVLGGLNDVNGKLKVVSSNNTNATTFVRLDYDGITAIKGEIGGWKIDDHSIRRDKEDSVGSNKINTLIQCPSGSTSTVLAIGAEYKNGATDWTTAPFRVTALGKMYATGAEISGKITATSGKIGGWDITTNSLRNETEGTSNNILIGSTTNNVLSIGATWTSGADATDWSTGKFRVLKNGSMYATAGEIGSWKITTNSIRREEKDGADALFLCPTGSTSTVLSIGAPTVSNSIKWTKAPFYVKGSGQLFASGASINGTFESKTGNQSVKIVNGIIYGYYGSTKAGLIDMSAGYTDTERIVSVRGENRLHLQGGSEIWFEISGASMHFTSKSLLVSTKIEGELHDERGFSGIGYLPTGFYQDGTVSGWVEVVIKDGIVR